MNQCTRQRLLRMEFSSLYTLNPIVVIPILSIFMGVLPTFADEIPIDEEYMLAQQIHVDASWIPIVLELPNESGLNPQPNMSYESTYDISIDPAGDYWGTSSGMLTGEYLSETWDITYDTNLETVLADGKDKKFTLASSGIWKKGDYAGKLFTDTGTITEKPNNTADLDLKITTEGVPAQLSATAQGMTKNQKDGKLTLTGQITIKDKNGKEKTLDLTFVLDQSTNEFTSLAEYGILGLDVAKNTGFYTVAMKPGGQGFIGTSSFHLTVLQSGVWTGEANDGIFGNDINWWGRIPSGIGSAAYLDHVDIIDNTSVNIDDSVAPLTLDSLIFDDVDKNTPGTWIINDTTSAQTGITLQVSSDTPTIQTEVPTIINSNITGNKGLRKNGSADLTLAGDISNLTGMITVDNGKVIIDHDLINMNIGSTLRLGGSSGGTVELAAGRTFTMPGNVSFDGDWGAGGVPGINVEILGNLNSGGYASGLYIGTAVTASGTAAIVHRDGDRMDNWGAGSLTLTGTASLTTLVNGPITNDYTGSYLVGSWSPGPTGAQFNMQDDTVATFANCLRTSVWGDVGSITLSNNARVRVYDQVRVGESTTGSLTMNDDTLMTAASMNIGTGGSSAAVATLNDNARIGLSGNLSLNPANDATITATLNVNDNASVSVGGDAVVNSSISLNGNAKWVIANNLNVSAVSNVNANASSRLLVGGSTVSDGALNLYSTDTLAFNTIADTGGGTLGTLTVGDGTNTSIAVAASVSQGTVTVNAGSQLTLTGWAGGAGAAISAVPEPSTWVLLIMGALGLIGAAWRRR